MMHVAYLFELCANFITHIFNILYFKNHLIYLRFHNIFILKYQNEKTIKFLIIILLVMTLSVIVSATIHFYCI